MTDSISRRPGLLNDWIAAYSKEQVTRTVYDLPNSIIEPQLFARNLRNRVAYTTYAQDGSLNYTSATYYSYDVHGNVDTLLQAWLKSDIVDPCVF